MTVFVNLLMFILISCACVFMTKAVPDEYAKINKKVIIRVNLILWEVPLIGNNAVTN